MQKVSFKIITLTTTNKYYKLTHNSSTSKYLKWLNFRRNSLREIYPFIVATNPLKLESGVEPNSI